MFNFVVCLSIDINMLVNAQLLKIIATVMETIKDLKSKKNLTSNIMQWRILCTKITVLCTKNRQSVNATLAKMTEAKSFVNLLYI